MAILSRNVSHNGEDIPSEEFNRGLQKETAELREEQFRRMKFLLEYRTTWELRKILSIVYLPWKFGWYVSSFIAVSSKMRAVCAYISSNIINVQLWRRARR